MFLFLFSFLLVLPEHEVCNYQYNFCVSYPAEYLPAAEAFDNRQTLSLYANDYDLAVRVSVYYDVMKLDYQQVYRAQWREWESRYEDLVEAGSNTGQYAYELEAESADYRLFSQTLDLDQDGLIVNLYIRAGRDVSEALYEQLKEEIVLYLN